MTDVARELGWRTVPLPGSAVKAASGLVTRLGRLLPQELAWVNVARRSVTMDTEQGAARARVAAALRRGKNLTETIEGAKAAGIV